MVGLIVCNFCILVLLLCSCVILDCFWIVGFLKKNTKYLHGSKFFRTFAAEYCLFRRTAAG